MRALVAAPEHPDGIELRDVPEPERSPGEVVVAVRATSINRGELNRLREAPDGWRPGWDVAGEVIETTDEAGPPVGARVIGFSDFGAWCERVALPVDRVAEIPDALDWARASTLPVAGLTALRSLRLGAVLPGDRVLVTGAAGGVGRLAVQLAHASGGHVTAVVGRPERAEGLAALGAGAVAIGLDELEPASYDVIVEGVGGSSLARALALVARGGTVVSIGNASREPTTFLVNDFYPQHARLHGFWLDDTLEQRTGIGDLQYLAREVLEGRLETRVDFEVGWEDAAEALRRLGDRELAGKAVLYVR
jgi:NADPH2:quinone reductase